MQYRPRDFRSTMEAAIGPGSTGIAPVSRYSKIYMGKIVAKIAWAQSQVGLPNEPTINRLKGTSIKTPNDLKEAYKGVEFIRGSRPLKVIEVCFEPASPETMRDYMEAACRYRDEKDPGLKVFIGTTQTEGRFRYMIENYFLPDGIVSTNMAPMRNDYMRSFAKDYGILLGPNIGYSSDNLVDCIEAVEFDPDGQPISGPAIQKAFPLGAINGEDYLENMLSTHPKANLMPTGGVNNLTARNLIRKGAALVGASAPAKKKSIVTAFYNEFVENQGEAAWDTFVNDASIMATEVYIGRLLRAEDKEKSRAEDDELNRMFGQALIVSREENPPNYTSKSSSPPLLL